MSSITPGLAAFKLAFQLSPLWLVDGIAAGIPGGHLPVIAITESLNLITGLASGSDISLDDFFANYEVAPGGTLISNQVGTYPFANQTVAANAIISQPLHFSLLMTCPARQRFGYASKLAVMSTLQTALSQHNNRGGTYMVVTPSYIYTNCLMTGMTDVSPGGNAQVQLKWQFDFVQPLLSLNTSIFQQAANSVISAIGGGQQTTGALSGAALTTNSSSISFPASLAGGTNAIGANTAPTLPGLPQ
jgi:hypothetical protein